MKKRLLTGLIPAVILALTAAAAFAAVPLTPRDIVEQIAVPMAVANDPEIGVNHFYSAEELAEIVRVLNENGIILEENDTIMQMVKNGYGLFEDTVISRLSGLVFSGEVYVETPEEQDWYDEQMMKIGCVETHRSCIPEPDNLSCEQAEEFASERIREAYGQNLQLDDRDIWNLSVQFMPADQETPEDTWSFCWWPKDPEHGRYLILFSDDNPAESVSMDVEEPDWTQPYTGEKLMRAFTSVYPWQGMWPQAVWQRLHEMMQHAELDPQDFFYREYKGYQLTVYPEPEPGEISREEAIRIAKDALQKDRAALESAVLTEFGGERAWLVALVIYMPWDGSVDEEAGSWVITVDSADGTVRGLRNASGEEAYIPEKAYAKAEEGMVKEPDYPGIAAEAVKKQYPDLDPLEETVYTTVVHSGRKPYVEFISKNIQTGNITVSFTTDGTVSKVEADLEGLEGDNLFARYWNVYGYFSMWDQSRWVQLEQDMAELAPSNSIDGLVMKATHYPEESSVTLRHEQAEELGLKAVGMRTARVNSCVLVDADPHPVWVVRVIISGTEDPVIGIDAETGETVFRETFTVDETPEYVLFSMPETWRKVEESLYE